MKILASILCGAVAIGVIFAQETNQKVESRKIANDAATSNATRYWSKGGLGIVNTNLYIVVKSAANGVNELIVRPNEKTEQTWSGQSVSKAEIVVFYQSRIWSKANLPDEFDLSKSIIISFERDKVRFFDFYEMSGGYYDRIKN